MSEAENKVLHPLKVQTSIHLKYCCRTLRELCINERPQSSMNCSNIIKTSGPKVLHNFPEKAVTSSYCCSATTAFHTAAPAFSFLFFFKKILTQYNVSCAVVFLRLYLSNCKDGIIYLFFIMS